MRQPWSEGGEERVSANWDESSSQGSRQIGHLKPLNVRGIQHKGSVFTCACVDHSQWKSTLDTTPRVLSGASVGGEQIHAETVVVMFPLIWTRWGASARLLGFETERRAGRNARREGEGRGTSPSPPKRTERPPVPGARDGEPKSGLGSSALSGKQTLSDEWKRGRDECTPPGTPPPAASCDFSGGAHDTTAGKPPIKFYFRRHAL